MQSILSLVDRYRYSEQEELEELKHLQMLVNSSLAHL